MAVPTRHMGFYAEEDLFNALEEERYVGRHPSRTATIIALLHEALIARARARGETLAQVRCDEEEEPWIGLERGASDGARSLPAKAAKG